MKRAGLVALGLWAAVARASPVSSLWDDVAHPNRPRCQALLEDGRGRLSAGMRDGARAALEEAARLCPASVEAHALLGELEVGAGNIPAARRLLERARALAGDEGGDARLAFHLGFVRSVAGDLDGSLVEYRRALQLGGIGASDGWLLHYDLGDSYMALGRLAEAIEAYRRAVRAAPQEPMAHLALAVALDRDEQGADARAEVTAALAHDPQLRKLGGGRYVFVPAADERYYAALAQLGRGRLAEARLALRGFVAELPDGAYVARARAHLAQLEGLVDARELSATAGADLRQIAAALSPLVAALERCLGPATLSEVDHAAARDGSQPVRVRLTRAAGELRVTGGNACVDETLARVRLPAKPAELSVTLPLAPATVVLDTPRR